MGQRHQVYARAIDGTVTGIHHQWLYGQRAAMQVGRMMKVANADEIKRQKEWGPFESAESTLAVLKAVYSVVPEEGYFHSVHPLGELEINDPVRGDNNDGITIFDFKDPENPAYCMMSVGHLECEREDYEKIAPPLKPFSAIDYLHLYYPIGGRWTRDRKPAAVKQWASIMAKTERSLKGLRLLRMEEVNEIFPNLNSPTKMQASEGKTKNLAVL